MKRIILPVALGVALFGMYLYGWPKQSEDRNSTRRLIETVNNLDEKTIKITPIAKLMNQEVVVMCLDDPSSSRSLPKKLTWVGHDQVFNQDQKVSFNVFVTKNAKAALKDMLIKFPEGTVVLKQKLLGNEAGEVLLYTGMLKREKGFNPECGDWEFFTVSGDGKNITSRGKLTRCMECHKDYPKTDFVTKIDYTVKNMDAIIQLNARNSRAKK